MDRVGEICLRTWTGDRREGREVGWWRVGIRGMSSFFFFFSLVVEKCGENSENSKRVMEQRFNYLGICPWWEMVLKRLQDFRSF